MLEPKVWLGIVGGQRGGHHIRYAHSKALELHRDLGLNFSDIYMLKAFLFCILFSHWTHFNSLEHEISLGWWVAARLATSAT